YRAAMAIGRRIAERRWRRRVPLPLQAAGALARALVFRWLLEKIGFAQTRLVIASGAPLPLAVATLWHAWGANAREAYGRTERGGALVSGQQGPFPRPGDVGTPAPNMRVTLGGDNEVLVQAPDLFAGYWRDPDATAALFREGRLATGDIGEWVESRGPSGG